MKSTAVISDDGNTFKLNYFRPKFLQNSISIVVVLACFIIIGNSLYSYTHGTFSTLEKIYKFSSRDVALVDSAVDIGSLLVSFTISYHITRGHTARWFAFSTFIYGIASFMKLIPHFAVEQQIFKNNTQDTDQNYMESISPSQLSCDYTFYYFLAISFILGIGRGIYRSSGFIFLDINVSKDKFPLLTCLIAAVGEVGLSLGYITASYTLAIYVNLSVPPLSITKDDPRWIGAWWIGFAPHSIGFLILSLVLLFFPKYLPEVKNLREPQINVKITAEAAGNVFYSLKRIMMNKIVLLDLCSGVSYGISTLGYTLFYTKYTEIQFRITASQSNQMIGYFSIVGKTVGVILVGFILTKFKPPPRKLIMSSIIMQVLAVITLSSLFFLTCPRENMHGHYDPKTNQWEVTEDCNRALKCSDKMEYSPICYKQDRLIFFSPCHAGCVGNLSTINKIEYFTHCACVPNMQYVENGLCSKEDCTYILYLTLVVVTFYKLIGTPVGNLRAIMRFRYVDDEDKGIYLPLFMGISTLFSFGGRLMYGLILDQSCLIVNKLNGSRENCWWYQSDKLKYFFNGTVIGFIVISLIADLCLCKEIEHLQMYEHDLKDVTCSITTKC